MSEESRRQQGGGEGLGNRPNYHLVPANKSTRQDLSFITILNRLYERLLFCERKLVVENLSDHNPVLTNDLKSDYNQCELVSRFHQLSLNE